MKSQDSVFSSSSSVKRSTFENPESSRQPLHLLDSVHKRGVCTASFLFRLSVLMGVKPDFHISRVRTVVRRPN